ncbi:MAG: A/G-specific adenine glycosylase [Phycisphaerae bacterium]
MIRSAEPDDSVLNADERRVFRRRLLSWFASAQRDLPWRTMRDPYRVWISEIMLQQTRVETVIPFFARFVNALPNVASLAAASEGRVLKLWEGLGYYSRGRNLHRGAQVVMEKYGGVIPLSTSELRTLPGIGRYTAAAIASICAGEAVAVLDGNVKRVIARLFAIESSIDDRSTDARLWKLAEALVSPTRPGDHNEAMMELGATICVPRSPHCDRCPVHKHCRAFAAHVQNDLPIRATRRAIPTERWAAALLQRGNRTLLVQRPSSGLFAGMWDLPNVVLSGNERGRTKLINWLLMRCDLPDIALKKKGRVEHVLTHKRILLDVYAAKPGVDAAQDALTRGQQDTAAAWVQLPREDISMSVLMQKALAFSGRARSP